MVLIALLTAAAGTAGFLMVVIGIHASERRALGYGPEVRRADAFARWLLSAHVQPVPWTEPIQAASQQRSSR